MTVSFGSLAWTVLELLCGGSIYTRKIQANRLPRAIRMASVSNIFFLRIKSLDVCHVIILQNHEWKALQLWSVCFLSSLAPAFPGMVSTASYQINTSKCVLSSFNSLQTTAPPGPFLVLATLSCSFNPSLCTNRQQGQASIPSGQPWEMWRKTLIALWILEYVNRHSVVSYMGIL